MLPASFAFCKYFFSLFLNFLCIRLLFKLCRISRSDFINLPYFASLCKSTFSFVLHFIFTYCNLLISHKLTKILPLKLVIGFLLAIIRTILWKYFSKKFILYQNPLTMVYFMLNYFSNEACEFLCLSFKTHVLIRYRDYLIAFCLSLTI